MIIFPRGTVCCAGSDWDHPEARFVNKRDARHRERSHPPIYTSGPSLRLSVSAHQGLVIAPNPSSGRCTERVNGGKRCTERVNGGNPHHLDRLSTRSPLQTLNVQPAVELVYDITPEKRSKVSSHHLRVSIPHGRSPRVHV
jgi:hypothetical protein